MKTAEFLKKATILKAFFIILTIQIITLPTSAWAHKVTVFAWVEGDTVLTESKFSGGKRVHDGTINVYAPDGRKLIEGRTNALGEYSFKIPQRTDLKIVLEAGMGHRAEWTLTRDEIGDTSDADTELMVVGETVEDRRDKIVLPITAIGCGDIEATMERVLDKKLKPIIRRLNQIEQQKEGPSITDILGGLGYILGLIGIAAYVHSRRRGKRPYKK